jgi:hypothetical protein
MKGNRIMSEKDLCSRRKERSSFYLRGFTTFALTAVSLLIVFSGLALYVTPRGRVAHWTHWTLAGLGKEQWASLHMTGAAIFILVVALHLFFNWKVLLGYLRLSHIPGLRLGRELAAATVLGALLVFGTLTGTPPLGHIVELREDLKNYWERANIPAPQPHAEELCLNEVANQLDLPVEEVVTALEEGAFEEAEPDRRAAAMAEANEAARSDMRQTLRSRPASSLEGKSGSGLGMGRMNLGEFCSSQNVPLDRLTGILEVRGISAGPSTSLRELAASFDMGPGQISRWLTDVGGGVSIRSYGNRCDAHP